MVKRMDVSGCGPAFPQILDHEEHIELVGLGQRSRSSVGGRVLESDDREPVAFECLSNVRTGIPIGDPGGDGSKETAVRMQSPA